jgi:hypothetical protein
MNEHIDVRANAQASARHGIAKRMMRATTHLNEIEGLDEHTIRPHLPDFRKVEVLVKDSRSAPPKRTLASRRGRGLGLKPCGPTTPVTHTPTFCVQCRGHRGHTPRQTLFRGIGGHDYIRMRQAQVGAHQWSENCQKRELGHSNRRELNNHRLYVGIHGA